MRKREKREKKSEKEREREKKRRRKERKKKARERKEREGEREKERERGNKNATEIQSFPRQSLSFLCPWIQRLKISSPTIKYSPFGLNEAQRWMAALSSDKS